MFFLHRDAVEVNDFPGHRKQYGFGGLNSAFRDRLVIEGEVCAARQDLPDYAVAAIRTGHFTPVEGGTDRLWEEEIHLEQ